MSILSVHNLSKRYAWRASGFKMKYKWAVDDVSFDIAPREIVAIVGESGSGKTTLARCLLRLIPADHGSVLFENQDIFTLDRSALRQLRPSMQMIFQHPGRALNPRHTVGQTLTEALQVHRDISETGCRAEALRLLDRVGLNASYWHRHPSELSGGQQQRVVIARALSTQPRFLIADEPTSSLDAMVRQKIMVLLDELTKARHMTLLIITHDIRTASHYANRIGVMQQGKLIEMQPTQELLSAPQHEYTHQLIAHAFATPETIDQHELALERETQ
ncbi:ABC transporter ATP-binding protein [candidate division KSB1 bacterium]|nr:ABC transporter ATP-binding protein [candidate division KSB1 bacterium]